MREIWILDTKEVKLLLHQEHTTVDECGTETDDRDIAANSNERRGEDKMSDAKKVQAYQQGDSSGYGRVPQPGLPTYTEAWALIEAARRMAAASDNANQEDIKDRNKVRDALRLNWRLWTIFQAEMTVDDTSNLPDDVRTNMLTLCKFVDKHTVEALKDPVPGKIATLIDINRNIASGLLASLENANKSATDADAGEPAAETPAKDEAAQAAAEALANLNTKV